MSTQNHVIRSLLMEKEMNHLLLLSAMSARIDVGYPWTRLYVSQPINDALYVFGLYEQVSVNRVQPSVGLSLKWVDRKCNG